MSSEDLTYADCYKQIMSLASEIIEEAEEDNRLEKRETSEADDYALAET